MPMNIEFVEYHEDRVLLSTGGYQILLNADKYRALLSTGEDWVLLSTDEC